MEPLAQDERVARRFLHVCMPTRGAISVPSHVFLNNYNIWGQRAGFGQVHQHIPDSLPVVQAREFCLCCVDEFVEMTGEGYEHWVLWMDDDMDPPVNSIKVMRAIIVASEKLKAEGKTENQIGILSALVTRKEDFDTGLVFSPKYKIEMLPKVDYEPGDVVEVEWCSLAFTMMRADWLKQLPKPRFKGNWGGAEEDHNFTVALREIGCIPYVHTGLSVGHYSLREQHAFFAYMLPKVKSSNGHAELEEVKHG